MAEDVARVVGARSPEPMKLGGKEVRPRPLSLKELGELERYCLKSYRRRYLESFSQNLDLLAPDMRDRIMQQKIEETAKWDLADLPPKHVVDWNKVRLNDQLRAWVDNYLSQKQDIAKPEDRGAVDRFYKKMVGAFIDQGVMSDEEYKELSGFASPKALVPYVSWWVTGTREGQVTMVWAAFSASGVTRDEVESDPQLLSNPMRLLELAQEIEALTAPEMGNT